MQSGVAIFRTNSLNHCTLYLEIYVGIWLKRREVCSFFPCGNISFYKDCSRLESPQTRMNPSHSGCKWCREMLMSPRKSSHRTLKQGCSSQI